MNTDFGAIYYTIKMFNYQKSIYENGHFSNGVPFGDFLQSRRYLNSDACSFLTGTRHSCATQDLEHANSYPESIASYGSDEHEEQYLRMQAPLVGDRSLNSNLQQAQSYEWHMGATPSNYMHQFSGSSVTGDRLSEPKGECSYPYSLTLSTGAVPYFGDQLDTRTSSCRYDVTSRDGEMRFRHFGRQSHLSKIRYGNKRSRLENRNSAGAGGKKKRYRPFAAIRERERLAVMNTALKKLKTCLPLKNREKKLSKKQILLSATIYIKHLSEKLDCQQETNSIKREKTVNLNKYNYILGTE